MQVALNLCGNISGQNRSGHAKKTAFSHHTYLVSCLKWRHFLSGVEGWGVSDETCDSLRVTKHLHIGSLGALLLNLSCRCRPSPNLPDATIPNTDPVWPDSTPSTSFTDLALHEPTFLGFQYETPVVCSVWHYTLIVPMPYPPPLHLYR